MGLTCELCGSTDFVKDQGVFVCQGCGCKYTVEEAREVIARATEAERLREEREHASMVARHDPDARNRVTAKVQAEPAPAPEPVPAPDAAPTQSIGIAADFSHVAGNGLQGAQAVNNYACQGWRQLLDEYKRIEHPSKERQEELGARAREVLMLLDNAARLEPENHVQNLLILQNCKEVAESAEDTTYYDQNDEGKWSSHHWSLKVASSEQKKSWNDLIAFHKGFLEEHYRSAHPNEVNEIEALEASKAEIQGRLAELKSEKKSHGLFDFSGKREVKDRMKPVQAELNEVNRQISALERNVSSYVEKRLKELESGYVRLKL